MWNCLQKIYNWMGYGVWIMFSKSAKLSWGQNGPYTQTWNQEVEHNVSIIILEGKCTSLKIESSLWNSRLESSKWLQCGYNLIVGNLLGFINQKYTRCDALWKNLYENVIKHFGKI